MENDLILYMIFSSDKFSELMQIFICFIFFREGHSLHSCGILLTGPPGAGKRTVAIATSKRLHLHIFEVSCYDLIGESVAATEARLKNTFQRGMLALC